MEFEILFKEKIELEKLVVTLTKENQQLKEQLSRRQSHDILFADWLLQWLDKKALQVKINTFNAYSTQINHHIEPYFRSRQLHISEITPELLEKYYAYKSSMGLSGATLAKHHSNIHSALKDAVKNKIIAYNPADLSERPGIMKYKGTFLSVSQLNVVLNHLSNSRLYTPVFLAGTMGLRRSEVLGLRWSDIDFENHTICIQHTVVKCVKNNRTQLIFSDMPKTKSSRRTLPLPDKIYDYLSLMKRLQCTYYAKNRKSYCKTYTKYVCVDEFGELIKPDYLSKSFSKLMKKLHFICRFHDLRHTCASLLIQNGIPLKYVSQWLGHSNIGVTSDVYVHLTFQDKVTVADKIDEILFDNIENKTSFGE